MTRDELIADWSTRHPGRGGADLVELVDAAIELGRSAVRAARDAALAKVVRLTSELSAMAEQLGRAP